MLTYHSIIDFLVSKTLLKIVYEKITSLDIFAWDKIEKYSSKGENLIQRINTKYKKVIKSFTFASLHHACI